MNLIISLCITVLLLNVVAGQSESGAFNGAHQGGKGIWNLQWIFNGADWDDGQEHDSSKEEPTATAPETTTQYPGETTPVEDATMTTESWDYTTEDPTTTPVWWPW